MGYLISQIIFCLIVAAILGVALGWLLHGMLHHHEDVDLIRRQLKTCMDDNHRLRAGLTSSKANPNEPDSGTNSTALKQAAAPATHFGSSSHDPQNETRMDATYKPLDAEQFMPVPESPLSNETTRANTLDGKAKKSSSATNPTENNPKHDSTDAPISSIDAESADVDDKIQSEMAFDDAERIDHATGPDALFDIDRLGASRETRAQAHETHRLDDPSARLDDASAAKNHDALSRYTGQSRAQLSGRSHDDTNTIESSSPPSSLTRITDASADEENRHPTGEITPTSSTGILGLAGAVAQAKAQRSQENTSAAENDNKAGATDQQAVLNEMLRDSELACYPVEEIEGIGKGFGNRLRSMGIEDTLDLLRRGSTSVGRAEISEKVQIEAFVIKKWITQADLLRLAGIRGQFAELLQASQVDSVESLAKCEPFSLLGSMKAVNAREHRSPLLPTAEMVDKWIAAAKSTGPLF